MKTLKIFRLLLFATIFSMSSCSKDDDQDQNDNIGTYKYDGINYNIKDAGFIINTSYDFIKEKEVISGFTLVFIDGKFLPEDSEFVTTDMEHGYYVEVELSEYIDILDELNYKNVVFTDVDGSFIVNINEFYDVQVVNNVEYGGIDDYDDVSILSPGNLVLNNFVPSNSSIKLDITFEYLMENGKSLSGSFKGDVRILQ